MRVLKVVVVMVIGPLMGLLAGFIVAGFLLPPDPSGRGAPGDGFLILLCMGISFAFSIPLSALFAHWSWRRSARPKAQANAS